MIVKKASEDADVLLRGQTFNMIMARLDELELRIKETSSGLPEIRDTRVVNETGANIAPHEIVKIGDPATLPGAAADDLAYRFQHVFKGESTDADTVKFGVAVGGIPADVGGGTKGVGVIKTYGVVTAKVDVKNVSHEFAKPSATAGQLESSDSGPVRIVYSTATGVQNCKVMFFSVGGPVTQTTKIGKPDANIASGGSGTVTIWRRPDAASAPAATTEKIDNVKHDWMTGGNAAEKDLMVVIQYFEDEGIWRIINASCEVE